MSTTRRLVRRLLPPIILEWLRPQPKVAPIWEGVYPHYRDVPTSGSGFTGDFWLEATAKATAAAIAASERQETVPAEVPSYHAVFSLLVALLTQSSSRLCVLDFGGAMGAGFVHLGRCLGQPIDLSYFVLDNTENCRRGAELFRADPRIRFSPVLPSPPPEFDVVFLGSVLQYVEDYRGLLRHLAATRARYILLGFLSAGDIPTFATAQRNVPGSVIAVWFFSAAELIREMEGLGYGLLFRSLLWERVFDMSNFPASHQLPQQCNLLFARRGT